MGSLYYYTNSPYGGSPIDGGKDNDKQVEKKLHEQIKPTVVVEGGSLMKHVKPKGW